MAAPRCTTNPARDRAPHQLRQLAWRSVAAGRANAEAKIAIPTKRGEHTTWRGKQPRVVDIVTVEQCRHGEVNNRVANNNDRKGLFCHCDLHNTVRVTAAHRCAVMPNNFLPENIARCSVQAGCDHRTHATTGTEHVGLSPEAGT